MEEMYLTFGKRVRHLREQQGITREGLCEEADVDVSFLSRLERGHVGISLATAARLADALGVTLPALAGLESAAKDARSRRLIQRAARLSPAALDLVDALVAALERQASSKGKRSAR